MSLQALSFFDFLLQYIRLQVCCCLCFHFGAEDRSCNSGSGSDSAAEVVSKLQASRHSDLAASLHDKFVWPGIDTIIEAYASHVEGIGCCCL